MLHYLLHLLFGDRVNGENEKSQPLARSAFKEIGKLITVSISHLWG